MTCEFMSYKISNEQVFQILFKIQYKPLHSWNLIHDVYLTSKASKHIVFHRFQFIYLEVQKKTTAIHYFSAYTCTSFFIHFSRDEKN